MSGFLLFIVGVLSLGAIYAILCLALNFEAGVDGLWDLGLVSFFGVGAYTYVLLTCGPAEAKQHYLLGLGLPIWVGVLGAGLAGALVAFFIGLPSLRLRKEYFLITTLAFAEVLKQVYKNELWLTNGVAGIYGLPQPLKHLFTPTTYVYILFLMLLAAALLTYFLVQRLTLSPFGRSLKALRENENLAMTAGINPLRYHLRAFAVAGFFSGIAGAFYVWYNTLIVPTQFSANITFFVWTAVIIGGIGNNRGALLAGFLFILVHDLLRFLQVSSEMAIVLTSVKTAIIGAILVVILRLKPTGLLGERKEKFTL
ncbi:MAG: branched-chain amino acid ABC transporter permease [Thermodesulfobacteriota bacterium]